MDTPKRIRWQLRKESPKSAFDYPLQPSKTVSQNLQDLLQGLEKSQIITIISQLVEGDETLQNAVTALLPRPVSYSNLDVVKRFTDFIVSREGRL
jgi:hypothetical protein